MKQSSEQIENTNDHYLSFTDLLLQAEEERRSISPDKMGTYGIPILDNFTAGIFPDELVVVGSDTGMGKSEMAYNIAIANAKRGRKVLLFSLEGNINEIAWRFTQREIASVEKIKTQEYRANFNPDHQEFAKAIMTEVYEQGRGENLKIFTKKAIPNMKFLNELIVKSSSYFDMFIIDHLHYITFSNRESEIEQVGQIMRQLKTLTDIHKKPVVVMSHLRKRNKKDDPTEQDLYGSSNIAKEATTVVLITRMAIQEITEAYNNLWGKSEEEKRKYSGTKIIIEKSRVGMPVVTKLGLVYDRQAKKFLEEGYLLREESQATEDDVLPSFFAGKGE